MLLTLFELWGFLSNKERCTLHVRENLCNCETISSNLRPFRALFDDVNTTTKNARKSFEVSIIAEKYVQNYHLGTLPKEALLALRFLEIWPLFLETFFGFLEIFLEIFEVYIF